MAESTDRQASGSVTFKTSAGLSSLPVIRAFVADACQQLGAPPDAALDLVQAVDEAATNVTLHGYKGSPGPVEITVTRNGGRLTVTIRDEAPPFDPTIVGPPDLPRRLEQGPIGGLGIHFMRSFTDVMIYHRLPHGGNELTFEKVLPPDPS